MQQNQSRTITERTSRPLAVLALISALLVGMTGCYQGEDSDGESKTEDRQPPPLEPTKVGGNQVEQLREKLKLNPGQGEFVVSGGKVTEAYLERTNVSDLSPLQELPLQKLYLNDTKVRDLSPLKDVPVRFLNLKGTPVSDVGPLEGKTLNTLWLNDTKVTDLTPLKESELVSLDISGTPVTDLSPLSEMESLQRLNIARSAVTDVTPLKGLRLQRIILTPGKIEKGLEVVRNMPSISAIHTHFPSSARFLRPAEFWSLYDEGKLPKE